MFAKYKKKIPYGYCHCGCGRKTNIAKITDRASSREKGKPNKYLIGHNRTRNIANSIKIKVDKKTGCWNWEGYINDKGYGVLTVKGKTYKAHYYIHRLYKKVKSVKGKELDHVCRNKKCVNPNHLRYITHTENVRRGLHLKLSMDKAKLIRYLYKIGYKMKYIAKLYDVTYATIYNVIKRYTWD